MLLIHQAGSVKIGEVVRYTVTYTPSNDRILPTPTHLHLKVKNSTTIALRAAWIHGPYALHVSAYSSNFNPHSKVENPDHDGVPQYEPMVKAGGSWTAKLLIPKDIRETGADFARRRSSQIDQGERKEKGSVTWIVEISSQILFSNSASVDFEVLVGRDQRSLELGFAAVAGHGHGGPGRVRDLQGDSERKEARRRGHVQVDGVFSKAVRLVVEDTETLWDKPALPTWEDGENSSKSRKSTDQRRRSEDDEKNNDGDKKNKKPKKRRNVHLVVLTHGLHSNLGADMLFLKESIDATVAQARVDARKRKASYRAQQKDEKNDKPQETEVASDEPSKVDENETSAAPMSGGQEELDNAPDQDEDDDEEETVVRGFNGNAVRTENGIQYLGKRLAKYILRFTYPDQPFLPIKKSLTRKVTDTFTTDADKARRDGKPTHQGSSIHTPREAKKAEELPYKFTSISFIGHSLGGLIQTYAIAYIHKHSPTFFEQIKPVNFVCMASPMLGLSNENPMYVKFALDFGLVGRTGQDLGLTWRPPTLANKGWNAMVNGFGAGSQKAQEARQADPSAKPLLRILPTGPAHQVLRMFRNRTVYSNVVNDGIVPLRTSCLLFLDWRGLGKVEKARRENGLIGTVAEWGWAELTGANSSSVKPNVLAEQSWETDDEDNTQAGDDVPQPAEDEVAQDNKRTTARMSHDDGDEEEDRSRQGSSHSSLGKPPQQEESKGMIASFFSFFTPERAKTPPPPSKKTTKILRRGQTVYQPSDDESSDNVAKDKSGTTSSNPTMRPHLTHSHSGKTERKRPVASRGDSLTNEPHAPPKTSIFESAGDILHPPLPSQQWITDPRTRRRTIFHDRVYHPEDIPPPPAKRSGTRILSFGEGSSKASVKSVDTDNNSLKTVDSSAPPDSGGMKVEEKIARAYHRDLSWRKVLVRLEPDAHNNMIVRRMFANAYGWPVVKHLCDTHFADTHAATTRDEDEPARERAKPMDAPISSESGEQVHGQTDKNVKPRTRSETREARDELANLNVAREGAGSSYSSRKTLTRQESAVWDDSYFETSDGEDSDTVDERNLVARIINPNPPAMARKPQEPTRDRQFSSSPEEPRTPVKATSVGFTDGHRGLAPISPTSPKSFKEVKARAPSGKAGKTTFEAGNVETVVADRLVEEPTTMSPTTTTSPGSVVTPGLRKSVEEQIQTGSPQRKKSKGSGSGGLSGSPD